MLYSRLTFATATLLGALAAAPLAAQEEMDATAMTCADFMAMDAEGQAHAMEAMRTASADSGMMAEGEGGMAAGDDAMGAEGSMMGEGESMEEGDDAMMAGEEGGMAADDTAAISAACEGHPDMMVMDAMPQAME